MTAGTKYKWLLLLFIWIGCFTICYLNIDTINRILDNREKKEILKKDTAFWKQNTKNISRVTKQQRLLSHEIESVKLGIIFLDDAFNSLACEFNLSELKVEMDSKLSQGDSMPLRLAFKSSLKNGLNTIDKIQTDYNFLPFRLIKIDEGSEGGPAEFNILLDYRYHLADMQ